MRVLRITQFASDWTQMKAELLQFMLMLKQVHKIMF